MSDGESCERLTGFVGTGSGSTWMELELFAARAVLRFHSRWMGDEQPLEVSFILRHRVLGSHSGALVLEAACGSKDSKPLPLPPSDGPIVLEYARVPPQSAELPGSDVMAVVGHWTDPWSLLLWLHADAMYDDGTQLPA
jgi:hypothetical protein